MVKRIIALLFVVVVIAVGNDEVYADGPGPTPTPGGPGGWHGLPIPDLPDWEGLRAKYNIPSHEEMGSEAPLVYFWEIDNWLEFFMATKAGTKFSIEASWGLALIVFVLILVLISIRFLVKQVIGGVESVYVVGVESRSI